MIRQANYMEKLNHEFALNQAIAEDFPKIEEALWEKGVLNYHSTYTYLRHYFCLLFSTSGIIRCESLYKVEFSDWFGLSYKQETDVHAFFMMIMQISTGKFWSCDIIQVFLTYIVPFSHMRNALILFSLIYFCLVWNHNFQFSQEKQTIGCSSTAPVSWGTIGGALLFWRVNILSHIQVCEHKRVQVAYCSGTG